jgi:hypothetical protein
LHFSVPALNHKEPVKRYQWLYLPQGMMNSLTICQSYVDTAIQPTQLLFPEAYIVHYVDDILLAAEHQEKLTKTYVYPQDHLINAGLQIASEKIQTLPPLQYLGYIMNEKRIKPQKVQIR